MSVLLAVPLYGALPVTASEAEIAGLPAGSDGWVWQNPLPQGEFLADVHFADTNTGWAVGRVGTIIATTDGGVTWSAQDSGTTGDLYSVHFIDEDTGWAVGSRAGPISSLVLILTTSDGGATWNEQASDVVGYLNSVHFIDETNGWAVGGDPTAYPGGDIIIATTDGGKTWGKQAKDITGSSLRSVHFVDENTGWAVGPLGAIVNTTDGGETWTMQDSGTTNALDDVHFVSASTGWAVGSGGDILNTTDGGETWVQQDYGHQRGLHSVHFIDENTGWVAARPKSGWWYGSNPPRILATTDGGQTWQEQDSGTDWLHSVYFVDANTGWAVGYYGRIVTTTDGGATWTSRSSYCTTHPFSDVHFVNENTGWAVNGWETFATKDGGQTWAQQALGGNAVHAVDDSTVWVVGSSGAIRRSTDGGETWTEQDSGTGWPEPQLYSVHFADTNTGWAVGAGGTILATTDGGLTWDEQQSGTDADLSAVYFIDQHTGWVVGGHGTILATTDGGETWTAQDSGTGYGVTDVHFVDGSNGWGVGGDRGYPGYGQVGEILRTTDGGATWAVEEHDTILILRSVHFVDENTGWALGHFRYGGGAILKTTDGGATWEATPSGTWGPVNSLHFVDENTGWAVGAFGAILRYDAVAPVSTAVFDPPAPDGSGGWYFTTPSVLIEAVSTGASVDYVEWRFENQDTWTRSTTVTGITDGIHTLYHRAADVAGNVEETRSVSFKVDTTPPETLPDTELYYDLATITLLATDNTSGVEGTYYRIADGDAVVYEDPLSFTEPGQYTLSFWSVDVAGNVEDPHEVIFRIHGAGEPDSYTMWQDGILEAWPSVLANDPQPATGALEASLVEDASHGDLTLHANGTFTYAPDEGFRGHDHFWYVPGADGVFASQPVTVTIEVIGTSQEMSFDPVVDGYSFRNWGGRADPLLFDAVFGPGAYGERETTYLQFRRWDGRKYVYYYIPRYYYPGQQYYEEVFRTHYGGGVCYGMAVTAAMFQRGAFGPVVTDFDATAESVFDLTRATVHPLDEPLERHISKYQYFQFDPEVQETRQRAYGGAWWFGTGRVEALLYSVAREAEDGWEDPYIFSFSGGNRGHATNLVGLDKDSTSGDARLSLYDSIHPATSQPFDMLSQTGYYSFVYPGWTGINQAAITPTSVHEKQHIPRLWHDESPVAVSYTSSVGSELLHVDSQGRRLGETEEGFVDEIEDGYRVETIAGALDSGWEPPEKYYLPHEDFTIELKSDGSGEEDYTLFAGDKLVRVWSWATTPAVSVLSTDLDNDAVSYWTDSEEPKPLMMSLHLPIDEEDALQVTVFDTLMSVGQKLTMQVLTADNALAVENDGPARTFDLEIAAIAGSDVTTWVVEAVEVDADSRLVMDIGDLNTPPVAENDFYQTDEDVALVVPAPGVLANDTDADGDVLTAHLLSDVSNGTLVLSPDGGFIYAPAAGFSGEDAFTYRAYDGKDFSNNATVSITVHAAEPPPNTPPVADAGGPYLVAVDGSVLLDGSGSRDPDGDALTYEWAVAGGTLDDATLERPTFKAGSEAGIYDVTLTVTDEHGAASDPAVTSVVVYDPSAGFVTGGGWLYSPPGAYAPDAEAEGKASFGFVSRYQRGANKPDGNTQFQFRSGELNFRSSEYDWLVVTGSGYARFKGTGTINGEGSYQFMIWAGDGTGTGGADTFRIKIWTEDDGTETIVYDNGMDQPIDGGSIVVHASKR